ncbi:MAG: hypothetical protein ACI4JX_05140 [Oscillospiraceae bacterium]
MQIKAGIKKEFIYFTKSFRMFGVLLAMIAFAILSPLMLKAANAMMEMVDDGSEDAAYTAEMEAQFSEAGEAMNVDYNDVFVETDVYYAFSQVLAGLSANAVLVLMLCMMGTAGGEQKKRSVMIPNCSGLTTFGYIAPKYIFYTIFTFVSTAVVSFAGYFLCKLLFGGSIAAVDLINYILANSIFCTFVIVIFMFAGISTGKAGISVAVIYVFINIFPSILTFAEVNKYNPFSLMKYSLLDMSIDGTELAVSIGVTVVLTAVCMVLTNVFLKARKIDNTRKV